MTGYIFKESDLGEEYSYSYEPWLFQHPEHLLIQSPVWKTYSVVHRLRGTVDAQVHINIDKTHASSPVRAPFGSIQCSSSLKPIVLFNFLEFICASLKDKGIIELVLINPPDIYNPYLSSLLNTFVLNHGFQVKDVAIGAVLDFTYNFEAGLNVWQKRRLRQANDAHLKFVILDIKELEEVYKLIFECRMERDYILSIDWDTLQRTVKTFQDRFILFGIKHDNSLIATSISINVGNKILYNFHLAHPRKYDHLSPVVMLVQGIHSFCKNNNFTMLDLGTSALDEKPNFSLLEFKLGLGARPTTKFTFVKNL